MKAFWFPSPLFFLPQPPSSDDLPEPGPSGSSCQLLPTGEAGLRGQKGSWPREATAAGLSSPLPWCSPRPCLSLPTAPRGPLSSRGSQRGHPSCKRKGGSFTSASSPSSPPTLTRPHSQDPADCYIQEDEQRDAEGCKARSPAAAEGNAPQTISPMSPEITVIYWTLCPHFRHTPYPPSQALVSKARMNHCVRPRQVKLSYRVRGMR